MSPVGPERSQLVIVPVAWKRSTREKWTRRKACLPLFDAIPPCPSPLSTHRFISANAAETISSPVAYVEYACPCLTKSNEQKPSPAPCVKIFSINLTRGLGFLPLSHLTGNSKSHRVYKALRGPIVRLRVGGYTNWLRASRQRLYSSSWRSCTVLLHYLRLVAGWGL